MWVYVTGENFHRFPEAIDGPLQMAGVEAVQGDFGGVYLDPDSI